MFKQISKISLFAFIGAVYYFISIILIQFLRTDRNFFNDSLSSYAVGNMGLILEIGIFYIGITEILISLNLFKIRQTIGSLFLLFCGIGILMIAVFPMSSIYPQNFGNKLHIFGCVIHFIFFPLAIFFLSKKLSKNNLKKIFIFFCFSVFFLQLILSLVFITKVFVNFGFFGLIEKIVCFLNTSWLLMISYKMIKPSEFESLFL